MVVVAVLVLAMLVPGCVEPPQPSRPSTEGAGPSQADARTRFVWNASDCREIIATFFVDSATLQEELPNGFTATPSRVPGRTSVGIDFFECGSSVLTTGPATPGAYASFWASVDPPPELMGDAELGYWKWDVLVPDPEAFAALSALGVSVRTGSVSVEDLSPLGGTAGEIAYDDLGRTTATTLPGVARPQDDGSPRTTLLREWSSTSAEGADDSALVMWQVNLTQWDSRSTAGEVEVPAASMAAKLYGSTRIPAVVGVGRAHLHDGYMELDAPAPTT